MVIIFYTWLSIIEWLVRYLNIAFGAIIESFDILLLPFIIGYVPLSDWWDTWMLSGGGILKSRCTSSFVFLWDSWYIIELSFGVSTHFLWCNLSIHSHSLFTFLARVSRDILLLQLKLDDEKDHIYQNHVELSMKESSKLIQLSYPSTRLVYVEDHSKMIETTQE